MLRSFGSDFGSRREYRLGLNLAPGRLDHRLGRGSCGGAGMARNWWLFQGVAPAGIMGPELEGSTVGNAAVARAGLGAKEYLGCRDRRSQRLGRGKGAPLVSGGGRGERA